MAKKSAASTTTYRQILNDISQGKFAPVYILMGEESYYIDLIASEIEKHVLPDEDRDFNSFVYYGADANIVTVQSSARQLPVMSDRIFVALKEAQTLQFAKITLDKLSSYISKPNPQTVLLITYKGDNLNATSEIIKAATKSGAVVFRSPEIKDYQLAAPVMDYCLSKKISIEDRAVDLLCQYIGTPLSKLFGEIDKLIVALGPNATRITTKDIEENIGISKDFNNFELISAISRKDYPAAMRIIYYFKSNPAKNPTILTTSLLFKFFSQLTVVSFESDKSDKNLMAVLGIKTPYALRDIKTGMRNYNARQVVNIIHAIREFDCKSKGINSFQNEYDLLQQLIFTIFTTH